MNSNFIELAFKYKDYQNYNFDNLYLYCKKGQLFTQDFIEYFKNRINWKYLIEYKKLSEDLLEKYADRIDWKHYFKYHSLRLSFVVKHKDWFRK